MSYKTILQSQKAHNRYQINKTKTIQYNPLYNYTSIDMCDINSIKMFVYNNENFKEYDDQGDIIHTIQGNDFTTQLFQVINNKVILRQSKLKRLLFLPSIKSFQNTQLREIYINKEDTYVENNIIYYLYKKTNTQIALGQFIPNINVILLTDDGVSFNITALDINYTFIIHQLQYLCQINPNQMNRTMNPTAYNNKTKAYQWQNELYITTIGLYNDKNQLIAISKLSRPIKKSNKIPTNVIITLDYIQ